MATSETGEGLVATTLTEKLIKISEEVDGHARHVAFQMDGVRRANGSSRRLVTIGLPLGARKRLIK